MHCCCCILHYTAALLPSNSTLWGCAAAAAFNSTTLKGYTARNTTTSTPQQCKDALLLLLHDNSYIKSYKDALLLLHPSINIQIQYHYHYTTTEAPVERTDVLLPLHPTHLLRIPVQYMLRCIATTVSYPYNSSTLISPRSLASWPLRFVSTPKMGCCHILLL